MKEWSSVAPDSVNFYSSRPILQHVCSHLILFRPSYHFLAARWKDIELPQWLDDVDRLGRVVV